MTCFEYTTHLNKHHNYLLKYLNSLYKSPLKDWQTSITCSISLSDMIGLIGMLLPLFGFDEHPRPEAWGWRFGLSVSAILISLQTDLSGHLLLGITLAILISVSSPLVLEKGQQKAAQ